MKWDISEAEARDLLIDLISIDSVNPSLVPGGAGEENVAKRIAEYTRAWGLPTRIDYVTPTRPNVVAVLGGNIVGEQALDQRHGFMINGHIDVVGVQGMTDPFKPRVEGDRVYGRGAADMKNGVVAGLLAMRAIQKSGTKLAKSVLFTGVADEEYASIGTEDIAKKYDADAALIMEGGSLPTVSHKGFSWVTVEVLGNAVHGSNYTQGIDAIAMMGRFLARVDALNEGYAKEAPHPLCGRKSIHASLVSGGKELSTYPDYCRAEFERRTLPKEDPAGIVDEFNTIIAGLRAEDPRFNAKVTLDFVRWGYEIDPNHPLVQSLLQAIRDNYGEDLPVRGSSGWMDSAVLGAKGIPTAIFGIGGHGGHDLVEWSEISRLVRYAHVVAALIVKVCGVEG